MVPPSNPAAKHPDEVVTAVAYTDCANLVPPLCSRVLDTGNRTHQERCVRFSVGVVPFYSIARTGGGSMVTALGPGLPLLLEDLGVGRHTRTKRVAVEHLSLGTTNMIWVVPELKETSVERFTFEIS